MNSLLKESAQICNQTTIFTLWMTTNFTDNIYLFGNTPERPESQDRLFSSQTLPSAEKVLQSKQTSILQRCSFIIITAPPLFSLTPVIFGDDELEEGFGTEFPYTSS